MIHVREVQHLLAISAGQKQRRDAEIINRASVVFLMAVWQTYVEALADKLRALVTGRTAKAVPTRLSTPSSQNIDALFENLLGIKTVSHSWKWRGMTSQAARTKLQRILALRHQIAHKGRVRGTVRRSTVLNHVHFVHGLAICLYNTTSTYTARLLGKTPFMPLRYGGEIGKFEK